MRQGQRGVVLLIALIALVAITLAGIALMRSVDTGLVIAGNLAFKQATVQAGDSAIEQAIEWLATQDQETLKNDVSAAGYYATWREGCDLTGSKTPADPSDDVQWQTGGAVTPNCGMVAVPVGSARLPEGYGATLVINRMCDGPGAPNDPNVYCSAYQAAGNVSQSTKTGADYSYRALSGANQQYYRITAQVLGPRNTMSIVQGTVAY